MSALAITACVEDLAKKVYITPCWFIITVTGYIDNIGCWWILFGDRELDNLKIEIPGKPAYLTAVRLAISSIAITAGFSLDDVEDVKTAVTEACKNVSCHGVDGFSDKYEVDLAVDEGHLEIVVKDDCDRHLYDSMPENCRRCPQDCDLGIMVIKSLMNEVEIMCAENNGQKAIRMVKEL